MKSNRASSNKSVSPWTVNSFKGVTNQHNASATQIQTTIPESTDLEMLSSFSPNSNPCDLINIVRESMLDVVGMVNSNQYDVVPTLENVFAPPVKRVLTFKNFVLYPPNPAAPPPITKEKPLGCRTVFVGGLPEKITEKIISEIFKSCGIIEAIKMEKFVFCHIRFSDESAVENALYFSGYTIKIEVEDEKPSTGLLHVDYAHNFDDKYLLEPKQPSVPQETHHNDIDYRALLAKSEALKEDKSFKIFISDLIPWLVNKNFTRENSTYFFTKIQTMHNKAKKFDKFKQEKEELNAKKEAFDKKQIEEKVVFDKQQSQEKELFENQQKVAKEMFDKQQSAAKVLFEKPFKETKDKFVTQQTKVIQQLTEIEKVYKAASMKKCWDHFTKAQRKNIEMWKKHNEDLKNALLEVVINEREEEEMELSDDEDDKRKTCIDIEEDKNQTSSKVEQLEQKISELQELVNSLQSQLEISENKLVVMETNYEEELRNKDNRIESLWDTLGNYKNEIMVLNRKCSYFETRFPERSTLKYEVIEYNHISDDTAVHLATSDNYNLENGS